MQINWRPLRVSEWLLALVLAGTIGVEPARLSASDPGKGDWPMWGGTPDRNQISDMKNVPTEWDV